MDADIVKRMKDEEVDLSRKLKAIRDLLHAYGEAPNYSHAPITPAPAKAVPSSREKVEIDGFGESARRTVLLSMMAMTTAAQLMRTRQLVEFVEKMGHEVSGENKVNALGALLSRSVDIISHGKAGWELADREKALSLIEQNKGLLFSPKENAPQESRENLLGADAGKADAPTSPFHGINL